MKKCIIMCAGEFTPCRIDRKEEDLLIAADNGFSYLNELGITPDLVIGDYDSLEGEGREALLAFKKEHPKAVTTLPVEKDDTDTMAAARLGLERGYSEFEIYAALGGRPDHTVANFQTLAFIKEKGGSGVIRDPYCEITVIRDETITFTPDFSGTFSLFSMDRKIEGVTIRGMQYGTDHAQIRNTFPIGVSNHFSKGTPAEVSVQDGMALVMAVWEGEPWRKIEWKRI